MNCPSLTVQEEFVDVPPAHRVDALSVFSVGDGVGGPVRVVDHSRSQRDPVLLGDVDAQAHPVQGRYTPVGHGQVDGTTGNMFHVANVWNIWLKLVMPVISDAQAR